MAAARTLFILMNDGRVTICRHELSPAERQKGADASLAGAWDRLAFP
jgi:hypothetical protein